MSCIFYDINIPFDDNKGKLSKYVKISSRNNGAYYTMLASLFYETDPNKITRFRRFAYQRIGKEQQEKFGGFENFTLDKFVNIHGNTIKKIFNDYLKYTTKNASLTNSKTNANNIMAFTSDNARFDALNYCADLIIELYNDVRYGNYLKKNENYIEAYRKIRDKSEGRDVALKVIRGRIVKNLIDRINAPDSGIDKEIKDKFIKAVNISQQGGGRAVLEEAFVEIVKQVDKENKPQLYNYIQLLRNFQLNEAQWVDDVTSLKGMDRFMGKFDNLSDEEREENTASEDSENDIEEDSDDKIESDSIARESQKKSFELYFDDNVRSLLAGIKKCTTPFARNEAVSDPHTDMHYAMNETLNVATSYDSNYVLQQLIYLVNNNNGFASLDEFKNALYKLASTNKELYGLTAIVSRMDSDTHFAHKIYSQLLNPIVRKIKVNPEENGDETYISNSEANYTTKVLNTLLKNVKSTKNNYDKTDVEIIVPNLDAIIKSLSGNYKANPDNIDKVHKIIKKYFPDIKESTLINILNSNAQNVKDFKEAVTNIFGVLGKITEQEKKIIQNTINANRTIRQNAELGIFQEEAKPDFSSINYNELNKSGGFITLAKLIANNSPVSLRLNSYNAKGKMSSDLGDNNRLYNVLRQINYIVRNAENNTEVYNGLEAIKEQIIGCVQFENSPFFFGVRDLNGKTIVKGLFEKNENKVTVNPAAADLFKVSLFDGIENRTTRAGKLYSELSDGDYFVTSLKAFFNPINTYYNKTEFNKEAYAGYFAITPADMPKNSIVQLRRYRGDNLRAAVKQVLFNEINTLIGNLHYAFNDDGTAKTAIDNSYKFYHYKGDSYFNDKGILTGNVFHLQKLASTYDFNIDEEFLALFPLYGRDGLIRNKDGKITLNLDNFEYITKQENGSYRITRKDIENILDDLADKWIQAYGNYAVRRANKYKNLIKNKYTNEQIKEFAINYAIAYNTFGDIVEGDFKFYKDKRTFVKRAKENQAGGKAYGSIKYNNSEDGRIHEINENNPVDILSTIGITVTDKQREDLFNKDNKFVERDGFRAITYNNTISKSAERVQRLRQRLEEVGSTQAERLAEKYSKITVDDAQSYITFGEWIRRMYALGELEKYAVLIKKILDCPYNEETDEYDTSGFQLNEGDERIQLQKNYYFDISYVKGIAYPRQIKNAEFVLVPQFLKKGTGLRDLHEFMVRNDIGQVNSQEASKASTRYTINLFNADGSFNTNAQTEYDLHSKDEDAFYYKNLYAQVINKQHVVSERNKFGIQISKKILDNLDLDNPFIKKAAEDYLEAYQRKIKNSFIKLIEDLGWKIVDGKIYSSDEKNPRHISDFTPKDFEKIYQLGLQQAKDLGSPSNILDYYRTDKFGFPVMPNFMNVANTKLQSIAQSLFNSRITRQEIPGYHVEQISDVGFDRKLKFMPECYVNLETYQTITIEEYNALSEEEKAKYSKAQYAECVVPRWFPNPYGLSDEELLKQLQAIGADTHVVYRIPTEGKQSVMVVKVVGFTPEAMGSVGIYPDDWIAKSGADMDNDSDWGMVHEIYWDEKTKTLKKKNSDNNIIIDSFIKILLHSSSLEELLSTSNFDDIKKALNKYKPIVERANSGTNNEIVDCPYDIFEQINAANDSMSGAKLKAFSVTRDTLNSLANRGKALINEGKEVIVRYDGYTKEKFDKLVESYEKGNVFHKSENDDIVVFHNKFAHSNNNLNADQQLVTVYSSQTTAHILDAVKEGTIPNENEFTFSAFKTLADLGIPYDISILYLMNPGIYKLVEAWKLKNSIYSTENRSERTILLNNFAEEFGLFNDRKPYHTTKDIVDAINDNEEIKNYIENTFGESEQGLFYRKYEIDERLLYDRLTVPIDSYNREDMIFDLVMALEFLNQKRSGDYISNIARHANPDRFGAKQTIFATRRQLANIRKYSEDSINGKENNNPIKNILKVNGEPFLKKLYSENSFYPYLNSFIRFATKPSVFINSKLFPLDSTEFDQLKNRITAILGRQLTEEQHTRVMKAIVASTYRNVRLLANPITLTEEGFITINESISEYYLSEGFNIDEAEFRRIIGIDEREQLFTPDDLINPSDNDIVKFTKLTPGQKVLFIKQNGFEGNELFDYLSAQTINDTDIKNKKYSTNVINYLYGILNDDIISNYFKDAFFNKNPYIRLTAIDLVKYAFMAEGFNFKSGNISKIIPTAALKWFSDDGVTNIITEITDQLFRFVNPKYYGSSEFYDTFIKTNSDLVTQKTIQIGKNEFATDPNSGETYEKTTRIGAIYIQSLLQRTEYNGSGIRYINNPELYDQLFGTDEKIPQYIVINEIQRGITTPVLYKVVVFDKQTFLYPLNTLERNEFGEASINPSNNKYLKPIYYETILNQIKNSKPYNIESIKSNDNINNVEVVKPNDRIKGVKDFVNDNSTKADKSGVPVQQPQIVQKSNLAENEKALQGIADNVLNNASRDANGFIDQISENLLSNPLNAIWIYNPSKRLRDLFNQDATVIQELNLNGESVRVAITRRKLSYRSEEWRYYKLLQSEDAGNDVTFENINFGKIDADNVYRRKAIESAMNRTFQNQESFYEVRTLPDEDVMDSVTQDVDNFRLAAEEASDSNTVAPKRMLSVGEEADEITTIAINMIDAIRTSFDHEFDNVKDITLRSIKNLGVEAFLYNTIKDNRSEIFKRLRNYYYEYYKTIKDNLLNFEASDGNIYSLGSDEFYNYLVNTTDRVDYYKAVRTLLIARNFGHNMTLDQTVIYTSEDKESADALNEINGWIKDIQSLQEVRQGFDKLFNIYFAQKYSTNPVIREGIVKLTEHFGELSKLDYLFSDLQEVNHKQIQTTLKYVKSVFDTVETVEAPEAVREYEKLLKEAKHGEDFKLKTLIDDYGDFILPYTKQFIEYKQKYVEELDKIRTEKGENSLEYLRAKNRYDAWKAKNMHQEAAQQYYIDSAENVANVLRDAPNHYLKYIKLNEELNDKSKSLGNTQEEADRKWAINQQINQLISPVEGDGSPKDAIDAAQAKALKDYIDKNAELRNKYWTYDDVADFEDILKENLDKIKEIEENNSHLNETELMQIEEYRLAKDWLHSNTVYSIKDAIKAELKKAYDLLGETNNDSNPVLSRLKSLRNRYDINGVINPELFTDDEIEELRQSIEDKYATKEERIIKDNKSNTDIYNDAFYSLFTGKLSDEQKAEQQEIIDRINSVLKKALDKDGKVNPQALFTLPKEELRKLNQAYYDYRVFRDNNRTMSKEEANKLAERVDFVTDNSSFDKHKQFYDTYLVSGDPELKELFEEIMYEYEITDTGDREYKTVNVKDEANKVIGKRNLPTSLLFGFVRPKTALRNAYLNAEKTQAYRILNRYTEKNVTRYYETARQKAINEHTYDEWFDKNHVYNPNSHKFEPLPIWTKNVVKEKYDAYEYRPIGSYAYRVAKIKDDKYNPSKGAQNYNESTGEYSNSKYNSFTEGQKNTSKFLQQQVNRFSLGNAAANALREGHAPRRYHPDTNVSWHLAQIAGTAGLDMTAKNKRKYNQGFGYSEDEEIDFLLLQTLRVKGMKPLPKISPRTAFVSDEAYQSAHAAEMKEYEEVKKFNKELEKKYLDKDYEGVFKDFIFQATMYEAKDRLKNDLYMLKQSLEDNKSYALNYKNEVETDRAGNPVVKDQTNYSEMLDTWAKRLIFSQHKVSSRFNSTANLLQRMASAKYMIFNVTGGIANVATGFVNIGGEMFAGEYFETQLWKEATAEYCNNIGDFIKVALGGKADSKIGMLTEFYNVVDYEAFRELREAKSDAEFYKKLNTVLYSFQSMGEHMMQNGVMLAMLKSNRTYIDPITGRMKFGTFTNFVDDLEETALLDTINQLDASGKRINGDTFINAYEYQKRLITSELQRKADIDANRESLAQAFSKYLKSVANNSQDSTFTTSDYKAFVDLYNKVKEDKLKTAREQFNSKRSLFEQHDFSNGYVSLKEDAEFTKDMIGEFKNKVISVNKKIHGVYDKLGAAQIEKYWYGPLVMQYHKHIYPGFMKRYRGLFGKGSGYNENRSSKEKGSYTSLIRFLTADIRQNLKEVNEDEIQIVESIQAIFRGAIDTVTNFKTNWRMLPEWEKRNIRRIYGDLCGMAASILIAALIYAATDDDDIKESNTLSTCVYLADRLFSESHMYAPFGIIPEAKTLYSSPMAAINGPSDLLETINITWNWMFNGEFNPYYEHGQYSGDLKLLVKLRRNIPIYRTYDRLTHMANNNRYYRIGDSNFNNKIAKTVANFVNPEE